MGGSTNWSAGTPDRPQSEFPSWGYVKDEVYCVCCTYCSQLKKIIMSATWRTSEEILQIHGESLMSNLMQLFEKIWDILKLYNIGRSFNSQGLCCNKNIVFSLLFTFATIFWHLSGTLRTGCRYKTITLDIMFQCLSLVINEWNMTTAGMILLIPDTGNTVLR